VNRISLEGDPGTDLPLSPGVVSGNLVFVSGQVPRRGDGTWITGSIQEQVDCVFDNLETILVRAGSSLARLCRVNVYLTRREDFADFNDAYRARFKGQGLPARTTLITELVTPPEVRIEIDAVGEI
jgi:2-iminobutanoate/2-iminopropanoate deaminase